MKKFSMRILFRYISIIAFLIVLVSCGQSAEEKFNETIILYNSWVDFCENKNVDSCRNFINKLEQFVPENFSPIIDLNNTAQNQKDKCLSLSKSILHILENADDGKGMSGEFVEQINSGVFENTKDFHFGVRNIVERVQLLGGTVTYRSEPGCGTQITVVL